MNKGEECKNVLKAYSVITVFCYMFDAINFIV